jgi:hypothetical protein
MSGKVKDVEIVIYGGKIQSVYYGGFAFSLVSVGLHAIDGPRSGKIVDDLADTLPVMLRCGLITQEGLTEREAARELCQWAYDNNATIITYNDNLR